MFVQNSVIKEMFVSQIFKIEGLDLSAADSRSGEYLLELSQQSTLSGASHSGYHFDYLFVTPGIQLRQIFVSYDLLHLSFVKFAFHCKDTISSFEKCNRLQKQHVFLRLLQLAAFF